MRRKYGVSVLTAALVCVAALIWCAPAAAEGDLEGPAGAQPLDAPDGQEAAPLWGVGTNLLQIGASSFTPQNDAAQRYANSGYIYSSGGDGTFWAPVNLPIGSLVTQICVWLYDNTANNIFVEWGGYTIETSDGDNPIFFLIENETNNTASGYHWVCLNNDHTIRSYYDRDGDGDQERVNYRMAVYLNEVTNGHRLGALQIAWNRQVSPAPGSATFSDVPTGHWAFQFVEALAASGITGGCGGGNFCPDDPLNRGQMAVFLSAALGLHWIQ